MLYFYYVMIETSLNKTKYIFPVTFLLNYHKSFMKMHCLINILLPLSCLPLTDVTSIFVTFSPKGSCNNTINGYLGNNTHSTALSESEYNNNWKEIITQHYAIAN